MAMAGAPQTEQRFADVLRDALLHVLQHQTDCSVPWLAQHFKLLADSASSTLQASHMLAAAQSTVNAAGPSAAFWEVACSAYSQLAAENADTLAVDYITKTQMKAVLQMVHRVQPHGSDTEQNAKLHQSACGAQQGHDLVTFDTFADNVKCMLQQNKSNADDMAESRRWQGEMGTKGALTSLLLPSMLMGPHK